MYVLACIYMYVYIYTPVNNYIYIYIYRHVCIGYIRLRALCLPSLFPAFFEAGLGEKPLSAMEKLRADMKNFGEGARPKGSQRVHIQ